jgi:GntR family transcriptional regulator
MQEQRTVAPWRQVVALLEVAVEAGRWQAGERLPSRGDLGREWGVGENVIRRAQEHLILQGLLDATAGSGTYVRERTPVRVMRRPLLPGDAIEGALAPGEGWQSRAAPQLSVPATVVHRLGLTGSRSARCVRADEEFEQAGRVIAVRTCWEPEAVVGRTPVVLPGKGPQAGRGLRERLAAMGVRIGQVYETPVPILLDGDQASRLGAVRGSPATRIEQTVHDRDGRPVHASDTLLPDGWWRLVYDMTDRRE